MKKAMFTVEVLVALFILFLAVTLSATASKFFNQILLQQRHYKNLYIDVTNIKEKISDEICLTKHTIVAHINGLEYQAECRKIKESRGFEKEYDLDQSKMIRGYKGKFLLQLYVVTLNIPQYEYTTTYYLTRYRR